ncbi:MAG: hypothetical protein ACP5KM_06560 [Conexivisphaera sp.]
MSENNYNVYRHSGRFTTKDLARMVVFSVLIAVSKVTTQFVPIPVAGLHGILYVPLSTIFMLTGVGLVRKAWTATTIGFVAGVVGLALPGGPGVLNLPMLVITGIVVDLFLMAVRRNIGDSAAIAASAGFLPVLFTTWLMLWGLRIIFGVRMPIMMFLLIFIVLHGALSALGGIIAYGLVRRLER